MNWDEITDEEWREFQAIPEQGHSHRAWVDGAIRKRLDQLRTDEAVERVARAINPAAWDSATPSWDMRPALRGDARRAIDGLLGEDA